MTYGEKVKLTREKLGWSQIELAEKMGYSGRRLLSGQKLISDIEHSKGPRGPSMPTRKALGEALGLDVEGNPATPNVVEMSAHFGPKPVPVIALAAAGEGQMFTDQGFVAGDGMYQVGRPPDLKDPYAFGVEVRGESMEPKYENGQVVIVDTTKEPGNGDYAVVGLFTGERYIKRWKRAGAKIFLESINPAFEAVETKSGKVQFAYKVVWVKER